MNSVARSRPGEKPSPEAARPRARLGYWSWAWLVLLIVMIGGWFYPLLGLGVPICFVAALLIAPFRGRKWCGTLCPRGSFFSQVFRRFTRRHVMPAWARSWVVRIAVLSFLMFVLVTKLPPVWGHWEAVGRVFVMVLTVTTVAGILVGMFTHERVWCAVCPAGTMANWMSRNRPPQLAFVNDRCTSCKLCTRKCPMDLQPYQMARPEAGTHPDCLKCDTCVGACPVQALAVTNSHKQADHEAESREVNAA